jgi:hypothetical protein
MDLSGLQGIPRSVTDLEAALDALMGDGLLLLHVLGWNQPWLLVLLLAQNGRDVQVAKCLFMT